MNASGRRPWAWRAAPPLLAARRVLRGLRPPARPAFRILLFHDVPAARTESFRRFAEWVKAGPGVIAPDGAEAWLGGSAAPGAASAEPCLFAFDDGFQSNRRIAEEVLAPLGIQALFFVSPGLIGLDPEEEAYRLAATVFDAQVDPEDLPPDLKPMSWEEIAELVRLGHTIGAHGMLHRRLTALAGDELEWEIVEAGVRLREKLQVPVRWFAYAFGDIGSISRSALEIIGAQYAFCRSGLRGANDATTGRLALRADAVDLEAPLAYQQLIAEGGLDYRYRDGRAHLDSISRSGRSPA